MRKLAVFAASCSAAVFGWQYGVPLLPLLLLLPAAIPAEHRRLRLLLVAAGLAAGLSWCALYQGIFYQPARQLAGRTVAAEATVTGWPRETEYGFSVPVSLRAASGPGIKAVLYADDLPAGTAPGHVLSTIAACRLSDVVRGESIDAYSAKGIFLFATAHGEITITRPEVVPLRHWPAYLSRALIGAIDDAFPGDTAPLIRALVTGNRDSLSDPFTAALQRTGLSHVVSVSGMHMAFLVGLLSLCLGPGRPKRRLLVCAPVILLFMAVAGNTPSVVRAGVMQLLLLAAPLANRESDSLTSLSAVLALLLLQNPFAARHIGLQLSFASVAGIFLFARPLYLTLSAPLPQKKALWLTPVRFLLRVLATSLAAILFTIPLVAFHFQMVSLISPLSNLLTLWAVSAAFGGGLLAGLAGLVVMPLARGLALVISPMVRYLNWVIPLLSGVPLAAVTMESFYYRAWLVFLYAVLAISLLWRGEKARPLLPAALCVLTFCGAVLFTNLTFRSGDLTVAVLDVGQGQSVVLRSGDRVAMVDCGGSDGSTAGNTAADYLTDLGRGTLDVLVLTHYHSDHAGGVPQLMERIRVSAIVMPDVDPSSTLRQWIAELAKEQGVPVLFLTEDTVFPLGDSDLTVYAPLGDGGVNEEGLSILCSAGDFDVLLTGDMPSPVEAKLVRHGNLPDIELLVVGHHGSKYSTSEDFLDAVTPELAVISVGYNSYGHPTDEVLTRLAQRHIELYRTDWMGTVTVTANH
ncbi:MAG: DNA internalization-related competence protein ComEC/Rec2 [Clostridiales bacterium]|nr:DNA internalization-related competence protein ComEC/Rec2 [Clostridiales bacterium]